MEDKLKIIWDNHKSECQKYNLRINKAILMKEVWKEAQKEIIEELVEINNKNWILGINR